MRAKWFLIGAVCASIGTAWAVELTAASNKAVLAEVLTRLHKAAIPAWTGQHGQAAVDSLCAAYGYTRGGLGRPATLNEFAAHVWGDWHEGMWVPYNRNQKQALNPTVADTLP